MEYVYEPHKVSIGSHDSDLQHAFLLGRARKLYGKKSVIKFGVPHIDTIGKRETSLELPRRDTAVEVVLGEILMLLATDGQLAILDADLEILEPETRHGESDAQRLSRQLDVVGRVPTFSGLRAAAVGPLRRKEKPEIAFEKRQARHRAKALSEAAAPVAFRGP
jgi:hypothetical protein